MKLLTLLLLLVTLAPSVFAQDEDMFVQIKDATKQNWAKQGGRSGTKYAIKLIVDTKLKTDFKNIWIGEENVPFDATLFSPNEENKINQGDSLLLTYNMVKDLFIDNSEAPKLPFKYIGAALVEAYIDGKPRYFTINSFREMKE